MKLKKENLNRIRSLCESLGKHDLGKTNNLISNVESARLLVNNIRENHEDIDLSIEKINHIFDEMIICLSGEAAHE